MDDRVELVYKTGMRGGKREVNVEEYPWHLYGYFSPPNLGFIYNLIGGSEELEVRGKSRDDLLQFIKKENLSDHSWLRYFIITDPDGNVERLERGSPLT